MAVIRRRHIKLGSKDDRPFTVTKRIGTEEKPKKFDPDPRSYWMPELQSGKPHVRYKPTFQSPKRGKWGAEETRTENYGLENRQRALAEKMMG